MLLVHIYCLVTKPITKDDLECLVRYPSIIRLTSMIIRFADDLGTSPDEMKRGDVPKSIQCYMHETSATEEVAREYIKKLMGETWKKVNGDRYTSPSPFSRTFTECATNLARSAQFIYKHGDGLAGVVSHRETKDLVKSLLIEPIQL